MNKIKIMSPDLANKIAAGEVVENQASVVKELVENSIDANATKIEVSLVDSGFQLIQIVDNGQGMSKEDLMMCFKPHATSKIQAQYDLFNIQSLGFRGEALASIASVAKTKISTNDGTSAGYNYDIYEDSLTEGYQRQGTNISVYNLFYNVPARLKYLQAQKSEYANIVNIITRFALMYPEISFNLTNDGKQAINTSGNGNLLQVISGVYSLETAQNMQEFNCENNDFVVKGYISNKHATRSNKRGINIFVNKRLVYNKELEQAIIRGYGEYLMERRYPIVVLDIVCDFQLIDVNVHPAKLEIRISKENDLTTLLESSLRNEFMIKQREFITKPKINQPTMDFTYIKKDYQDSTVNYPGSHPLNNEVNKPIKEDSNQQAMNDQKSPALSKDTRQEITYSSINQERIVERETKLHMDVIGQFNGTYILTQSIRGFHIVDQHAAMERINYELKLDKIRNDNYEYQNLVVPIIIPLTLTEKIKVLELKKVLSEVGLNVEEQANNDLIIRQLPLWVDETNANEYVQQTIDYVLELKNVRVLNIKKEDLIMASCKMSLKANHFLSLDEQIELIERLLKTENYDHCPHGRPIIVTYSVTEIEKMFKRIV